MNSSEMTASNNRRFFFASLACAVGLLIASGYFAVGLFSGGDSSGVATASKTCLDVMRTNGFNPEQKDDLLVVEKITAENIEGFVYRSGVIVASCPTYTLQDFCAGMGCQKPGVSFTLKHKEL